jgi:hypothetical protein
LRDIPAVGQALGFDVHEPERLALAGKLKITGLSGLACKNLSEKSAESRTKPGGNQPPKRLAHQTGTFDSDPPPSFCIAEACEFSTAHLLENPAVWARDGKQPSPSWCNRNQVIIARLVILG